MALTLLIDLDDTLLVNDIDTFLPAYLKALGKHMTAFVAPELMIQHLLAATKEMLMNNAAGRSLEHSFDGHFYPAIGRTKEELRPTLEQFYDDIYPDLSVLTSQRPEAYQLVKQALKQGHTLVVATNPLFPRKAIDHRLRWAGLPPESVPFALITTYERFHFAKPNPAYLAEILAQLGWPDQPAVMIGNSLEDDLTPASQLGLPVFWVNTSPEPLPTWVHPLSAKGSLADAANWIEQIDAANLQLEIRSIAGLLAVLKSTPAALNTLYQELTERQWQERPEPEEWSVTEIFCHLRDVDEEVNLPRIEKVLSGENPFLPGVNSDSWTDERAYCDQDGKAALDAFIEARTRLVDRLENIPETAWQLTARHAIFGPTNLTELVSFMVTHDRSHIQQVYKAVEKLG